MTDEEIRKSYENAISKPKQIGILVQLTGKSREEIKRIVNDTPTVAVNPMKVMTCVNMTIASCMNMYSKSFELLAFIEDMKKSNEEMLKSIDESIEIQKTIIEALQMQRKNIVTQNSRCDSKTKSLKEDIKVLVKNKDNLEDVKGLLKNA